MAHIWNVSEAASLGLHALALLAHKPDHRLSTREIASRLKVSESHLSKVLQRLAKAGLVSAVRGPKGGFVLKKDPKQITLLKVYEVIEGPMSSIPCLFDSPICKGKKCIIMGDLLKDMLIEMRTYLKNTRLSQLDFGNDMKRARGTGHAP